MIQPINNQVLLEVVEDEKKDTGFAFADQKKKGGLLKGRMIGIDPALKERYTVNTILLFPSYGYDEIVDDGKSYVMVSFEMIKGTWIESQDSPTA